MIDLLKNLEWRYATKKYDSTHKVEDSKVMQIIEAARMAPTSSGIQPFEMVLVKSQEIKEQLVPVMMGQTQAKDCSHVLVFAAWDSYTVDRINRVFTNMETIRGLAVGEMDEYKASVQGNFDKMTALEQFNHAARQAYIAFGMALAAAAELRVDTTPMEGFHNAQLDEVLGLDKRGLKSVTVLAIGQRDVENDWLAPLKKVRFSLDEILTIVE